MTAGSNIWLANPDLRRVAEYLEGDPEKDELNRPGFVGGWSFE
jgi:hypothetical protein